MKDENEIATERVKRELHRALDDTRADLDRVEIWTAGLVAFSRPIPAYQPKFQHLHHLSLSAYEIGGERYNSPRSSRR